MEETINRLIAEYSQALWLGFISMVLTGFIMLSIKDFIADLINYFSAKMSDIGFGQRIIWQGDVFIVDEIKFRYLIIHDVDKIVRIPLKTYLKGPIIYPKP